MHWGEAVRQEFDPLLRNSGAGYEEELVCAEDRYERLMVHH